MNICLPSVLLFCLLRGCSSFHLSNTQRSRLATLRFAQKETDDIVEFLATFVSARVGLSALKQMKQNTSKPTLTQNSPDNLAMHENTIENIMEGTKQESSEETQIKSADVQVSVDELKDLQNTITEAVEAETKLADTWKVTTKAAEEKLNESNNEESHEWIEKPSLGHKKEGDRNIALKDEIDEANISASTVEGFADAETSIETTLEIPPNRPNILKPKKPLTFSSEFGRSLPVIQENVPPLREPLSKRTEEEARDHN